MEEIIDYYHKNGKEYDELEFIFGSNEIEERDNKIFQSKSGKIFTKSTDFTFNRNSYNNRNSTSINYDDFNRLIAVLKNHNFIINNSNNHYHLNITCKNRSIKSRVQILGLNNIKKYCNTNILTDNFQIVDKALKKDSKLDKIKKIYKYNYRINYKTEKKLSEHNIESFIKKFKNQEKIYRYIKRFTFIKEDCPFKIDCSIVKTSKKPSINIKDSNVFSNRSVYEVEMELLPRIIHPPIGQCKNIEPEIKKIKKYMKLIFSALQNTNYPIDNKKMINALKKYNSLAHKNIVNRKSSCLNDRGSFFGPQSVTLQREKLKKETDNNILTNYCVTDKADGERKFLYISDEDKHNVYLLDMNMKVQFSGLTSEIKNTIIDGEYIEKLNEFWAFDIYYNNGKMVSNISFYDGDPNSNTRYNKLKSFVSDLNNKQRPKLKKINNDKDLKIKLKHFEFTKKEKTIFNCCKNEAAYEILGLTSNISEIFLKLFLCHLILICIQPTSILKSFLFKFLKT